jgi:[ribosomal protein S18]-alanine N-acetyltransferase
MTLALPELEIRLFQTGDLEAVSRIEEACFDDPYPQYFFAQLAEANPETFLVALFEEEIVGYAIIDGWADHDHLISIAVHPEHRRKGVAQALLDRLESRLSGKRPVRLEVRRNNTPAVQFYTKNGYRYVGVEERYYRDGEDALIMEKTTPGSNPCGNSSARKGKSLLVG